MYRFESILPDELALLTTTIAVYFGKILNLEELNVLGNFLVAIGGVMLTIASQEEALKKEADETAEKELHTQIEKMTSDIKKLQQDHY